MRKISRVLVVRKKSAWPHASARRAHRKTLTAVTRALRQAGLRTVVAYQATARNVRSAELVVAVGGDGTFLEAARGVRSQLALGVNSDPARSIGSFCAADAGSFARVLRGILRGKARVTPLHRIRLRINDRPTGPPALNEVLVTHRRPAAMSRYRLQIGRIREEQRSSGLWISTAAGSTGAILSAGGRGMPRSSRRLQYRPRELYAGNRYRYRLRGGVVPPARTVAVVSLMSDGMVCIDGEHITFPLRAGDRLEVTPFPQPLRLVIS